MSMIDLIIAVSIFIGVSLFGIHQYRKSKKLQQTYRELSDEERKILDHSAWHIPEFVVYTKPMSKGMWVSAIIGILFSIWVLINNATL